MARNAIRDPRHIPTPKIIGHQPDLFDGPTITQEVRRLPIRSDWGRQLRAWAYTDTMGDLDAVK